MKVSLEETDDQSRHLATQNAINESLTKFASEAVSEMERLSIEGGLQKEDVKRTIWNILAIFRGVVREQLHRIGAGRESAYQGRYDLQTHRGSAIELNRSIINAATKANRDIRAIGIRSSPYDVRTHLAEMMQSYQHLLSNAGAQFNEVHVSTMLHRISSVVAMTQQKDWLISEYDVFVQQLLSKMVAQMHIMSSQTLALGIWSLGQLGPQLRTMIIDQRPYAYVFQQLLEETKKKLPQMTARDLTMISIGCANSHISPVILQPFLRILSDNLMAKLGDLKPDDYGILVRAFSNMQFDKSALIFSRLCSVVEQKFDEMRPQEISFFLGNLSCLGHPGTPGFIAKCAKKLNEIKDSIGIELMIQSVDALASLGHYPDAEIVALINEKMINEFKFGHMLARIVCRYVSFCSRIGVRPEEPIRLCKQHFVSHPNLFTTGGVLRLLLGLTTLNELDEHVMKSLSGTTLPIERPERLTLEHRRQLCRAFITLSILQNKEPTDYVPRETVEMCYSAWRAFLRNRISFGIVPDVFAILGEAGFDCKNAWILEKVPIRLSSAVLPMSVSGFTKELNIAIDIIARDQTFSNKRSVNGGLSRWRQLILQSQGWYVLDIQPYEWNQLRTTAKRSQLLYDLIKENTGYSVEALLHESRPSNRPERISSTFEGKKQTRQLQTASATNNRKTTLSEEDLGPLSRPIEIDERFHGVFSADEPTAASEDEARTDSDLEAVNEEEPGTEEDLTEEIGNKTPASMAVSDEECLAVSDDDELKDSEFDEVLDGDTEEEEVEELNSEQSTTLLTDDDKEEAETSELNVADFIESDLNFESDEKDVDYLEKRGRQTRGDEP